MKYFLTALLAGLVSLGCSDLKQPTEASDSRPNFDTTTENFFFTVGPFTSTHPCTGEPITYSGDAHVTVRQTTTPSGGSYFTFHVNMQGVGGETASGDHFQLVQTSNDQIMVREGETSVINTLAHKAITGGDSPNFLAHTTIKVTIDANGQRTVVAENIRAECQGETT
jgi:hypothetical protein